MSDLEKEFEALVEAHQKEIQAKVDEAEAALAEAERLSDKYGIPFYSDVSRVGQGYNPRSFTKFRSIPVEKVEELTGVSEWELEYSNGWQRSAVC